MGRAALKALRNSLITCGLFGVPPVLGLVVGALTSVLGTADVVAVTSGVVAGVFAFVFCVNFALEMA
jgi:positive regulator of sigma E activity